MVYDLKFKELIGVFTGFNFGGKLCGFFLHLIVNEKGKNDILCAH